MNVALAVVALPPALALGSFLNVVAARLPEGRSLASVTTIAPMLCSASSSTASRSVWVGRTVTTLERSVLRQTIISKTSSGPM